MNTFDFGIIGLVMGRNLLLNMADQKKFAGRFRLR
jgi:6-phosphogluconate dehydrogenase